MGYLLAAGSQININLGTTLRRPSSSILIILALSVLTLAPSILILLTGFTRIVIVLGLTRQALGLSTTPPNQVLVGVALFVSIFLMEPTLSVLNHVALQPYLHGQLTFSQALHVGEVPVKRWLLAQTGPQELALVAKLAHAKASHPMSLPLPTLIPAFLLNQLKDAFIIGFVIYVPFLVIDLVVASTLMSMGIVMLPPTLVSLPFKLLLFVLVDGWVLVIQALVVGYR